MMKSSNPAGTLAAELRTSVRGEVRFDNGSRAMYATDASNYRQVPVGVVIPKDVDDVIKTVAAARRYSTPIFTRGGGTSLAGQCCNAAVVIDMSKYMNQVISIDPRQKLAPVQPGTILDDLRHAAEHFKLTFGPDPATHSRCTLGGMIGNNSCGVHSVMSGMNAAGIIPDHAAEGAARVSSRVRAKCEFKVFRCMAQVIENGARLHVRQLLLWIYGDDLVHV